MMCNKSCFIKVGESFVDVSLVERFWWSEEYSELVVSIRENGKGRLTTLTGEGALSFVESMANSNLVAFVGGRADLLVLFSQISTHIRGKAGGRNE